MSRLFALLAGAAMLIGGVAGFFYEPSFATGDELEADEILSTFPTNGWDNLLHVLLGLAGLGLASRSARAYALGAGSLLILLAVWGAALDPGESIAGLLPVSGSDNLLHLIVGVAGVGAWLLDGGRPGPARERAARSGLRESGA